jgi:hypothetical protein
VTADALTLPGGRRLNWHEYGAPVIYTAGTPVSGLGGAFWGPSSTEEISNEYIADLR